MNITDHIFSSNQAPDSFFGDTYLVWKPGNRDGFEAFTFVLETNPDYDDLPTGKMTLCFLGPMALCYLFGWVWVCFTVSPQSGSLSMQQRLLERH